MENYHTQTQVSVESSQVIDDTYVLYTMRIQILKEGNVIWETHIRKRFSDFITLKQQMQYELSQTDFPYELPSRQYGFWSKQQSISNSVIQERRVKLSKFLYDMLNDSFDNKWRNTQTLARFLHIPRRWESLTDSSYRSEPVTLMNDDNSESWASMYRDSKNELEECKKLPSSDRTKRLIQLRLRINRLEKELETKEENNEALEKSEIDRRRNLLAVLKQDVNSFSLQPHNGESNNVNLNAIPDTAFHNTPYNSNMSELTGTNNVTRYPVGRRRLGETEETAQYNNQELLTVHKDKIKEQDKELLTLHKAILRQKDISIQMNQELSQQNEVLDAFSDDINMTANKLKSATRRATNFNNAV